MKGWNQIDNMVQVIDKPCPGDKRDYYWDYPNKKWVFIEDDMDMTWAYDRLFGYDAGPGERLRKESKTITGKDYKRIAKISLRGNTMDELLDDARRKGLELPKT